MHTGLLDSFAAFWGKVAQEFSTSSSVIGYEIINEPWAGWFTLSIWLYICIILILCAAGNFYHDPLLMVPGVADRENLANVYDVVSDNDNYGSIIL